MSNFKQYLKNSEFSYVMLLDIVNFGVDSGVFMPCVTYSAAKEWIKDNEKAFEDCVEYYDEIGMSPAMSTLSELYCTVYSWVVDMYAIEVVNLVEDSTLEEVLEDKGIADLTADQIKRLDEQYLF